MEYYYVENPELIINAEHLDIKDIGDFPYDIIKNLPDEKAKRGEKKHDMHYVHCFTGVDLECTKIPEELLSVMFMFQIGFKIGDNFYFVGLRNVETVKQFLENIANVLGYTGKAKPRTMILFDFNWNFEYGFTRSWFKMYDMFFKDPHHPLYGYSHGNHFEWRDAQALFGPGGLAGATKGLKYEKLSGDLDYSKKRFAWTKIDGHAPIYMGKDEKGKDVWKHSEFDYCVYDVWGLASAVEREMAVNGNGCSLFGLKRTFTGWTRKDISKILYPLRIQRHPITQHDSFSAFMALEEAKRGGNTHCNKEYAGHILSFACKDVSSMYPDAMIHEKFGIEPFTPIYHPDKATLEGELERDENQLLMRLKIYNLELKDEYEPVPYVSKSKCRHIVGLGQLHKFTRKGTTEYKQDLITGEEDNGRISYCCYMEVTWLSEDFKVAREMYNFDYDVIDLWKSRKDYLPEEIREYLIELYQNKTNYSGKPEFANERARAKVRLNSVYGLFCANILTDTVYYNNDTQKANLEIITDMPRYRMEEEYEDRIKKLLIVPRIGVQVCSICRLKLQRLINLVGVDMMYCDTDSVFYLNPEKHEADIEKLNEEYKERAIESGAYGTGADGITHYCGVFEDDKSGKIISMGAKKYAYEHFDEKSGKVKTVITVAGVPKSEGSKFLAEKGGLEAFKPGLVFDVGKLRPIYNTDDSYGTRHLYDCDGVEGDVEITSNICLVDVEYELNYGKTYGNLIEEVKKGNFDALHEMLDNTDRDALVGEVLRRKYHLETL